MPELNKKPKKGSDKKPDQEPDVNEPGTLLGPLTTVWSQPLSCSIFYTALDEDDLYLWAGQRCASINGDKKARIEDDPDCWPPRAKGVKDHKQPFNGWGFYSPGIKCPKGYRTACSAIHGDQQWDIQYTPKSGETAVGCCPEGFSCMAYDKIQICEATTSSSVLRNAECSGTESANMRMQPLVIAATVTTITVEPAGTGPGIDETTVEPALSIPNEISVATLLQAPMFQLVFQSTDITTTTPAATLPVSASTGSAHDSSSRSGGGLSTGAKVGIGVGVGVGGILLATFVTWFFLLRRKSKRTLVAELGSSLGRSKQEATPTQTRAFELSSDTHPVELPTG